MQSLGPLTIPRFYFPNGKPVEDDVRQAALIKIDGLLKQHSAGLTVPAIKELLKDVRVKLNSQDSLSAMLGARSHGSEPMVSRQLLEAGVYIRMMCCQRLWGSRVLMKALPLFSMMSACRCGGQEWHMLMFQSAQVLGLPSVLAYALFYKLVAPGSSVVTQEAMEKWFTQNHILQVRPFR